MKRKIIKLADTTYVVSLPLKWARKHNIKKGDEMNVEEAGNKLVLALEKELIQKELTKEVNLDKLSPIALRIVANLYKYGYDELDVKFNQVETLQNIQKACEKILIGYEIVSQSKDKCLIKDITSTKTSEFDTIMRRIFLITLEIAENFHQAVKDNNKQRIREVRVMETTNNKFTNLNERLLNKMLYTQENKKALFLYTLVWEMEKIADEYKYMCYYLVTLNKIKQNSETIQLLLDVTEYLRTFYEVYYKFDPEKIFYLNKRKNEIIEKCNRLLNKKGYNPRVIHHTINIVQMIFNCLGCYFAVTF